MYCLEKLQRELAYFFDMDLRELPRVQDLLAAKGYTQVQKGDEIIKLEPSAQAESTLAYTDTKGHTHQIPSDIAQKWLETFGLKDLQETYTPQFSEQVAKTLESTLQGEQITLSANSLVKLMQRDRLEFLPYIKETLEHSDIIIKDKENALIFAKDIGQTSYFTSVSKNDKGEWVISTNSYKTLSQLKNRVSENGEVLYLSKEAPNILAETFTTKAFSNELASEIIPQTTKEKPKWSRAEHKKWKLVKLEQTKAAALKLYEQLQPIYNQARPLLIKAKELKSTAKAKELQDKAWKLIEQESKPFIKELEQHELELDRTAFTLYPKTASIKIQPKSNFNLEWKNKVRGAQGLKGAAKYRAQALQRLSEKDYMTPFEQATKASNPLTQLHALKFEILKDLHKAKLYINQQDYDKDLNKTYRGYVNRTSNELDSIEQSIRELKNSIVPKPQRVEQMRNKVQDFIKWRDEVRFDTDYLLALESDGIKHALEYLEGQLQAATLPQQANFINQLKEQIKEHFPTPPTPPSPPSPPKPTPPEPSSRADEVGAAIHTDTPKADSSVESTPKDTQTQPTQKNLFDEVDSSVETKELHTKTTSKLTKEQLEALPLATAKEYGEFLEKIAQKDYQNTPEILKIATLNNDLQELINNNHSASVFITRARAGHISEARKGEYDQALTLEEQKQIPAEIAQAKEAYTDEKSGFILPFADKNNSEKINLIILDSDSKGNFLITAKKVNSAELDNPKYKKLARAGVEPATTTPPKAEQKPTEAISLARDEIIPQSTAPLSKQAQEYAHKILQGLRKTAQTPLNKLADEEPYSTDRGFMLRNARYKKQSAQEFADNFANLHWQDLKSAIRYTKVPYDEAMFKELKESIESKEFAKFIESSYPPNLRKKSLFDEADSSEAPPSKINFTYTTGGSKGIAELRKDLKQALEPYKSTPITNKETGLQGVVTDTERNKISSKKAVDKSIANGFTRDEHFAAAQDLKNLFENATKAQSHNDYKQRENIAQVHRFVKDLYINDKQAQAKITLFEKIEGKNKIYTLELESLENPTPLSSPHTQAGVAVEAQVTRDVVRPNANIAKTDEQIVAQNSNALLESTMKKFNYDERKAKDLLEWHKDSHPLTKDENGVPKVFYHGTSADKVFEVFDKNKIHSGYGFWFGSDIADRAVKENTTGKAPVIKAFLQMKKPFIFSNQGITAQNIDEYAYITGISKKRLTELYEAKEAFNTLEKMIQRDTQADSVFAGAVDYFEIEKGGKDLMTFDYRELNLSDQTIAFLDRLHKKGITARGMDITPTRAYEDKQEAREILERLKEKGYDSIVWADNEFVVFEPNQIKHIENRGIESEQGRKYFNEKSPNIFQSSPHAGAGLLGGSVAGVEQDENGEWHFSPEKFALGLLGGAVGSKAVAKGLEWRANKVAKSYPNIAKDNPALISEIAKRDLQTYAMTNAHNALTRFLNNNKLFDINPQLFAGEKALVNEAYAPHKARLERAKELESSGADEIEIWEKTGWYKDKDKKWKFEISQSGGELYTKDEYARPYKREYLHKILKDDELFNAYPKLRDLRVIEDKKLGRGVSASYDPKLKDIYIKNLQAKEAKISLYHEIQHAIQDIEGFAYGFKDYVTSDENFHKYAIQHGEVEARNVESRMKLPTKRDVQNLKRFAKDRDKNIEFLKTSDYEEWYKNKRIKESQSEKKHFLAAAQTAQEIINKGKYTDHPHKTMDTPLKDTIAEATMQGEALSKELESSFLDSSGKIDYKSLMDKAEALPEQVKFTRFKEMIFTNPNARQIDSKNAVIQTPAGEVKVNVLRAFSHYRKNAKYGNHKENRQAFNATFMPTLLKPKFVTKDELGTLYYYKPFISKDKEYHITSIAVKRDGTLDYATSYNATQNRLKQMIKDNELIYKEN